jgi:hypothetical protein
MRMSVLALLACAGAAMAETVIKPVEVRYEGGVLVADFRSERSTTAVTFRTSPDSTVLIRGSVGVVEKPSKSDSPGRVTLWVLTASYDDTNLLDLKVPWCTLEVFLPRGIAEFTAGGYCDITFDQFDAKPIVRLDYGKVWLLNHSRSASVHARSLVCTIHDLGPADTVALQAWEDVDLYFPKNLGATVEAPERATVDGFSVWRPRAQGMFSPPTEKFVLGDASNVLGRQIKLGGGGHVAIHELSAYGKQDE